MGTPLDPCSLDMVREYLKENLTVRVTRESDWDYRYIKVAILIDNEVVSSDCITVYDY